MEEIQCECGNTDLEIQNGIEMLDKKEVRIPFICRKCDNPGYIHIKIIKNKLDIFIID